MPRKPPTTPQPSPLHYWHTSKGEWRLRKGNRPHDPAEEAERVAGLREVARLRIPTTEMRGMNQAEVLGHVAQAVDGEVLPAPVEYPPPPVDYAESENRLIDHGLDEVLALIEDGHSNREICKRLGARPAHLNRWLESMPEGRARVRDAKRRAAQAWLDRGLAALEDAQNLGELAKAREIAQICRRYAAISDPAYSDRLQVDQTIKADDPATIDQRLRALVSQVVATPKKTGDE